MGLYSLGPFYPATAESISESPFSGLPWINPGQVTGDGTKCSTITDAAFDTNVKSYVLKAYNFSGFSAIPDGAAIVGVQSDFNGIWVAGVTAPQIALGQLLTNQRAKGGTNQYEVGEPMSSSLTTHSKGGYGDVWGNALSAAWVKHSGFGVAYAISAKSNNTDASADYIQLTVWYTAPDGYTVTNDGGVIVVTPDNANSKYTDSGTAIEPAIEGAAEIGYGGVSTVYFATELNAGVPSHDYAAVADISASVAGSAVEYTYVAAIEAVAQVASDRFRTKQYESSVSASVQAESSRFRAKDYTSSIQAGAEASAGWFRAKDYVSSTEINASAASSLARDKFYTGATDAKAVVASDVVRATLFALAADAAFTVDAGAGVSVSITGPQAYTYESVVGAVAEGQGDLALAFVPAADSRGAVAVESTRFIERLPLADAAWNIDVASDVSAEISEAGNVEVGTAAWELAGGVSVVYFSAQSDAGVPLHEFAAEGDCILGHSAQDIAIEGAVAAAFSVGDSTLAYDVIIFPVLEGSAAESFTYDSVQVIYSTPVYSGHQETGTAAWRVAEPVTEYWVDISSDRNYPVHGFAAAADYFSGARTYYVHTGSAAETFAAESSLLAKFVPVVGATETITFAAGLLAIISQQVTHTGTAEAVFSAAGTPAARDIIADAVADVAFAASSEESPPYAARDIQIDGDATAVFTQRAVYSTSVPTAYAVDGDAAFASSVLAEKAVANLHEALAEYVAFAAGGSTYTAQFGYSHSYGEEPVPGGLFTEEAKPTDGYTLEAEPTLPAGQDGAWTVDGQDGVVTEPPKDGAYTDIGYFKEWKPWWQTRANEGKPTRSSTREGKPT